MTRSLRSPRSTASPHWQPHRKHKFHRSIDTRNLYLHASGVWDGVSFFNMADTLVLKVQ
jgi:hypothetical protein